MYLADLIARRCRASGMGRVLLQRLSGLQHGFKKHELPASYRDLSDPKWKGRLARSRRLRLVRRPRRGAASTRPPTLSRHRRGQRLFVRKATLRPIYGRGRGSAGAHRLQPHRSCGAGAPLTGCARAGRSMPNSIAVATAPHTRRCCFSTSCLRISKRSWPGATAVRSSRSHRRSTGHAQGARCGQVPCGRRQMATPHTSDLIANSCRGITSSSVPVPTL